MAIVRAKLSQILPVMQQRLMAVLGFPKERVKLSCRRNTPHPHEQYVVVRPRSHITHQVYRHGGGRADTRVTRRVAVELWTRLALDETGDSEQWLLDASLGHLDREHQIFDALENFQPLNAQGDWLVYQPLKLYPTSDPDLEEPDEPEWGRSVQEYDVSYVLDLSQDYQ